MPTIRYQGEERLRVDYHPATVRGQRRAIGLDAKTAAALSPLCSGEITLRFEDRVGFTQELEMPVGLAVVLHHALGVLLSDPSVREQALNGRRDTAADLESYIEEALRS